jgi:peptidoglycan-associated lipoprotein
MNNLHNRCALAVLALSLAGSVACATTPTPWVEKKPGPPVAGTGETEMPTAMMPEARILKYRAEGQAALEQALAALRGVKVFFAFDDAALTKEATDKLAVVADILNRHADLDVKIEGNTDQRGTAQYNLALGQKRADAVKSYLGKLGVQTWQIKAISLGQEQPADQGKTEDAFAKNRNATVTPSVEPAKTPAKK